MGHFRLDVRPDAVRSAGRFFGEAAAELDTFRDRIGDVETALTSAWEGDAARAAARELDGLHRHLGSASEHFTDAADALIRLADVYREALDVALPDLNRRWDDAHEQAAAAVAAAGRRMTAALASVPVAVASMDLAALRVDIAAASADAISDANAALQRVVRRLEAEFDELVERLRHRTLAASDRLARAVIVPVPAVTVALYAGAETLEGWWDVLLPGPDVVHALSGSLALGTLSRRAAEADDLATMERLLSEARRAGLPPAEYRDLLKRYWIAHAMQDAGIDPADWDPSKGADANRATIEKVYAYYGQLYLDDPRFEWAAMANAIGPSFAAGFLDLAQLRRIGEAVADLPGPIRSRLPAGTARLAELTAEDIAFYETRLLEMQKKIFVDQGAMHAAYVHGGIAAIEEMHRATVIDPRTVRAWRKIDSGDAAAVRSGNRHMLDREQFEIIAGDYDRMRRHSPTGPAVTWAMTWIGQPSIPNASGYADVFPETIRFETGGPRRFETPSVFGRQFGFDNPTQARVRIETPFPEGNIANRYQRWELIETDTWPRFTELADRHPEQLRAIARQPVAERIEQYRLPRRIDDLLGELDDWKVDVDQ